MIRDHIRTGRRLAPFLCLLAMVWAQMGQAQEIRLTQPMDCTLGEDCFVQLYVDRDPGPGYADLACGALSYDAHTGTDFALPSLRAMGAGVDVLAAAPGIVTAIRDGMPDISVDTPGAPDVGNRGCGNAVILRHAGGWETQYCHLRLGTVTVEEGERVVTGTVLGQVGLSGNTSFPHLEFLVRHNREVLDPFRPTDSETCDAPLQDQLWDPPIPYIGTGLIDAGFSGHTPTFEQVQMGLPPDRLSRIVEPITVWIYLFGGQAKDVVAARIIGPDGGVILERETVLAKGQYTSYRAFVAEPPAGGWPAGPYTGIVTLSRDGAPFDSETIIATLP